MLPRVGEKTVHDGSDGENKGAKPEEIDDVEDIRGLGKGESQGGRGNRAEEGRSAQQSE